MSASKPDPEAGRDPATRERLQRSLGLFEALTIGAGTMIGAGIFLFPGLAGGEAGMAAILSFALGGGVALLVALPASELATALPRSGGGYQFVSRSLGTLPGSLVGIGQWMGLIFATAFYLAGFGEYVRELIRDLGVSGVPDASWMGFGAALLLTGLAILGTRHAGKLQDTAVGLLLLVLLAFLAMGLWMAFAGDAVSRPSREFAPRGLAAVLPTTALIFTSYLGFIQITTVAGDLKDPDRNIPRAMLGSIGLVLLLYVLTLFLTTYTLGPERLQELGGTALTEVARALLGGTGAFLILGAGLLATVSSANASILGASRSIFALGRDGILPGWLARINPRRGTPAVALAFSGGGIGTLVLLGHLEFLAEVASILHLVMYGLLCFALIAFRRAELDGYRPRFRSPGYPWLPALGGILSFALLGWMEMEALAAGGIVLLGAGLWTVLNARDVRLRGKIQALEREVEAKE